MTAHDLQEIFDEINELKFKKILGVELPKIEIVISTKMIRTYGRFFWNNKMGITKIKISQKHIDVHELDEVKETLLHEMVHFYEWTVHKTTSHGYFFMKTIKQLGGHPDRFSPVKMSPDEYPVVYKCTHCGKKYGFGKTLKNRRSCSVCCPNKYNPEYILKKVK